MYALLRLNHAGAQIADDMGHTPLEMAADREYEESSKERNLIMAILQKPRQAKQLMALFLDITTRLREDQASPMEYGDYSAMCESHHDNQSATGLSAESWLASHVTAPTSKESTKYLTFG